MSKTTKTTKSAKYKESNKRVEELAIQFKNTSNRQEQEMIYEEILKLTEGVIFTISNRYTHKRYEEDEKVNDIRLEMWNSLQDYIPSSTTKFRTYAFKRCHVYLLHHIETNLNMIKRTETLDKNIAYAKENYHIKITQDDAKYRELIFKQSFSELDIDDTDRYILQYVIDGYSLKEGVEKYLQMLGSERSVRSKLEHLRKKMKVLFNSGEYKKLLDMSL